MLQLSCKFGESKWNPYWVIVLTSSSGINYVLNEYEENGQYGPYAIPSELKSSYSYPVSLVNKNAILTELSS